MTASRTEFALFELRSIDADDVQFATSQRDSVPALHAGRHRRNRHQADRRGAYDAYFHVTGLASLAEKLSERGADIVDGLDDRVYGQRELVVRTVTACSSASPKPSTMVRCRTLKGGSL